MSHPKQSLSKQIATALRAEQLEVLSQGRAEIIPPLLEFAQGSNSLLANRARQVLQQLQTPQTREALCRILIDHDQPLLLEIAREAEYRPADLSRRALFYFVTEQWEAYDALDFDRRLLRAIYQTAEAPLRRRIAAKVQSAGRVDYLSIVAGNDYNSGNSNQTGITSEEFQLILYLLADKEEWQRLWELVPYLPLEWSIQAIRKLSSAGWQPDRAEERAILEQLQQLVERSLSVKQSDTSQVLNRATLGARIRVVGRVKALAFAPSRPLLAIATGNCKVVLWDLQKAEQEAVLEGFKYPVGSLAFLPDGTLLCGERPQTNVADCKIYGFQNNGRFELSQNQEAVTSLQVVSPTQVLSIDRAGRVILRDVDARTKLTELGETVRTWSPTLCLTAGKERLAVLHNKIELYEVANSSFSSMLRKLATSSHDHTNSLKYGAFSPTGQELVTGRFNGEIVLWSLNANGLGQIQMAQQGFKHTTRPNTTVEGLITLMDRSLLLLATSDGTIQYFDWQTKIPLGKIQAPGERLSSLQLSPDEAFLAVGDRDQSFSLWDLRLLALSHLFTEPLAAARPSYLSVFAVLNTMDLNMTAELETLLKFIELVLHQRFRYEIELGDFAIIQPGDFDIELDA